MSQEQRRPMTEQELESLKNSIAVFEELEKSRQALAENEDFNKIVEFYCQREALRYTNLLADGRFQDAESRRIIQESLIGISKFSNFLISIPQNLNEQRAVLGAELARNPGSPQNPEVIENK